MSLLCPRHLAAISYNAVLGFAVAQYMAGRWRLSLTPEAILNNNFRGDKSIILLVQPINIGNYRCVLERQTKNNIHICVYK